jgi:hypothetical protein
MKVAARAPLLNRGCALGLVVGCALGLIIAVFLMHPARDPAPPAAGAQAKEGNLMAIDEAQEVDSQRRNCESKMELSRFTKDDYLQFPEEMVKVSKKSSSQHPQGHQLPRIHIVYFAWLDPKQNFKHIIHSGMNFLNNTGLCASSSCTLSAELVTPLASDAALASDSIKSFFPKASISHHCSNRYEWYGLHKARRLAQLDSESLILYLHDKGVTHGPDLPLDVRMLYHLVVGQWRHIVELFRVQERVTKFGFVASPSGGHEWFNFFWARAAYLRLLPEPIITERRHYYESWLGSRPTVGPWKYPEDGAAGVMHTADPFGHPDLFHLEAEARHWIWHECQNAISNASASPAQYLDACDSCSPISNASAARRRKYCLRFWNLTNWTSLAPHVNLRKRGQATDSYGSAAEMAR